ncbi:MAG TPA: translocation/assembly module TamB domain-containing protein [Bryobacteraceae bacterium]|jgi:translocation and assembly module TamB
MSRRTRKGLWIGGIGLLGLIVIAVVVGIQIVQTDWFRAYVKQKIVTATEDATGGTVDIGSFHFDWKHLRAIVTDFVIHGREPAGAAPLLRVPRVEVDIRLFTSIHHIIDVAYLGVDRPDANIIVLADGSSNVPQPKPSATSGNPPLQSILNAAIGHFDLNDATIAFADARETLSLHANKFRAELWFNAVQQAYRGELSFQPLYVISGGAAPVTVRVTLPVVIEKDSVALNDATIATAQSNLRINGSVEDLRNPKISARVLGQLALADLKNLGMSSLAAGAPGIPAVLDLDANAAVSADSIQVSRFQLNLGKSSAEASGTLKDSRGNGSLQFQSQLALDEIGKLVQSEAQPKGTVALTGTVKLDASNNYDVNGDLSAQGVSIQESSRRFGNINLTSSLHADPHNIALKNLRVDALDGGQLEGNASLQEFARYQFQGALRNFTLQSVATIAGQSHFPYSGTIQGPIAATGDLKTAGSLSAQIKLSIAPGKSGIPVSGRLTANYDSSAGDLRVQDSYIALPHSRLSVSGTVSQLLNVSLTTSDLSDFLALTGSQPSPVNLAGHAADFAGKVSGGLAAPRITGHLHAGGFSVQGRMFDSLTVDASASNTGVRLEQGTITRSTTQMQFSGQVGMNHWKITPLNAVNIQSSISNSDLADVLALTGQPVADTSGMFDAAIQVNGTIGNPAGTASLAATNGMLRGEPFNRIQVQVNLSDQMIAIPNATVDRGNSHILLAAEYRHARDSLATGQLHARLQSNQIDLAQVQTLQRLRPGTGGTLELTADVTGDVRASHFQLVQGAANASAHGLEFDRQNYGDLTVNARSSGQTAQYQAVSNFAGSNIRLTGATDIQHDYETALDASITNLPIERALAAARRTDIPAKGTFSAAAHFSGTKDAPTGNIELNLTNAVLYQEPIERLQAKASYEAQRASIEDLEITAAGSRIGLSAEFDHPQNSLKTGNIKVHLNNSRVDLARVRNLQMRRPGLGGALQISGDGAAELHASGARVSLQTLQANLAATGISLQGKTLGDATLTANTQNNRVNFTLASSLAGASIQGRGSAQPAGDYPVDAEISFRNVEWANLQPLIGSQEGGLAGFNAGSDGQMAVRGPLMKPEQLSGSIRLTRVEVNSAARTNATGGAAAVAQLALKNAGPVSITLDAGNLRIDSAHLTGPQTDIQAAGSMSLKDGSMNLTLNANANLAILQTLDRDFSSSGNLIAATTVRGTISKPALSGSVQLKNATVNSTQFPNGISNANGTIDFAGNTASLRSLTGETGGGKVTLTGFLVLADTPRFGLRANASNVRIDVQQGVSVVTNANINFTGTKDTSTLSGQATIVKVNYAPTTDLGSILTRAAPPVQGGAAPSFLDNVKLSVQVTTSDALQVQSSLAQSLEGNANLRVQGTASHPSVLGRVTMTDGTLTFFGNSYTVNSGTISFFNPIRIEPILDASLETNTEGVDVTLHVTGPIDNLKLSYTSDPPLQFEEIIGLLATGKTPTSDPTLLANNPPVQQSFTQMGESAVLGQALANPVANRLERVFGVTQLKINPEFTNGSSTPQTTLTLQQQVTKNVTFSYITQVDNANAETIRVEISLNPEWSAAAMRDENGIFSINFFYKRQFH